MPMTLRALLALLTEPAGRRLKAWQLRAEIAAHEHAARSVAERLRELHRDEARLARRLTMLNSDLRALQ